MADLSVNLRGIKLKNPVMPASGPLVRNAERMMECVRQGVGALVTKTISETLGLAHKPFLQETKSGAFLNSELWSEIPIDKWIGEEYEKCRNLGVPFIISLGYTEEEIEKLAPLVAPYADIIELSTHYMERDIEPVIRSLKAVTKFDKPVYIKINPGITKIGWYVKRLVEEGASGFVAVNSFGPCLHIDVETGLPYLGNELGYGWLSGKALNPIALRYVYTIANSVKVPVIGVGGISSGEDVIAMIMAGASAVQICTAAILEGPEAYARILREVDEWLDNHGYKNLDEIRGLTARKMKERNANKNLDEMRGLTAQKIEERNINEGAIIFEVDKEKCTSCGKCVKSCPYGAITMKDKAFIDKNKCYVCGLCSTICGESAINNIK